MTGGNTYEKFARFYDTYVGNFRADLPLYVSLCKDHDPILEIGCGTGRVLEALLEAGHTVTGVDISPEMLSVAEKKLAYALDDNRLTLINHDFRHSPLAERFACVLVTFYTFNYLLEDKEQSAFVRNILAATLSRGLVVIDLFYPRPKLRPETADHWEELTYDLAGKRVVLKQKRRMIEEIEERTQIYTEEGNSEDVLTLRRYVDKQRIKTLLTEAGFVEPWFTDGYDLPRLHKLGVGEATTSSFVVVAQKP